MSAAQEVPLRDEKHQSVRDKVQIKTRNIHKSKYIEKQNYMIYYIFLWKKNNQSHLFSYV